jgi:putative ABC transport system substrate-binding protein
MTIDLSGKRLELLKEAVPHLSRVVVLTDVTDQFRDRTVKAYQASGERLGISVSSVLISKPDDIEPLFAKIAEDHANGVVRGTGSLMTVQRERIGAAALAHRLPIVTYLPRRSRLVRLCHMDRTFPTFSAAQ